MRLQEGLLPVLPGDTGCPSQAHAQLQEGCTHDGRELLCYLSSLGWLGQLEREGGGGEGRLGGTGA